MSGNASAPYIETLTSLRQSIPNDPKRNPTEFLAYQISTEIENGSVSIDTLGIMAKDLSDKAFVRRAKHIKNYVGLDDGQLIDARLLDLIAKTIKDNSAPNSFEDFKRYWENTRSGAVFTAHPTFGMSHELRQIMVEFASASEGVPLNEAEKRLSDQPHKADESISLKDEHGDAQKAIKQLQGALNWLNQHILQVARDNWPEKWTELNPAPLSVASWVGYDLDGRTDIGWQQMLRLRLAEKAVQLSRYHENAQALQSRNSNVDGLPKLVDALNAAKISADAHGERFEGKVDAPDVLADAANALTSVEQAGHVTSVTPFIEIINSIIGDLGSDDENLTQELVLLRSEMINLGLGTAHLHFRINTTQLHNGFAHLLEMDGDAGFSSRMQLSKLNELIEKVVPHKVSFRSLMHEGSSAIRQFILIAQILKHVDQDTPIRFLIAECESSFTVLVALYFARLFGIEHKVDISPLFETPSAMEKGVRILEQLTKNEHYLAYIKLRGRISIQTGFSDAGRFIGQIPATLAVERLQMKLARLLGHQGMSGIEVLFFNTHGESIGRGAHPISMSDRLNYVLSPAARSQYVRAGIPLVHETSFQGGDGYLLFGSDELAKASVCNILENAYSITDQTDNQVLASFAKDPFYRDTDFSLDFFLHLKSFQERLFDDADYRAALGSFGVNLLYKTGSRKSIRQHESANPVDRGNPRQMRAIPHNAILQQLGYTAHVISGVGTAVGDENERFVELCQESDRALRIMSMVAHAKRISSLNTLGAYARLFDPGYWMARAYAGSEPSLVSSLRDLSAILKGDGRFEAMTRLTHHLRNDAMDLHEVLNQLSLESGKSPDEERLQLDLLHAIRIALIEHIFILAAQIPPFAEQHGVDQEKLMALILSLEIPEAIAILRNIFPKEFDEEITAEFDEVDNFSNPESGGYRSLHESLIKPMEEAYDLTRQIGVGISHHFLAHG